MTCRIVVLLSGRGSNFRAIAEAGLPIEIVAVVSNRPKAAGLDYARERGIPAIALDHGGHADREAFDALLADEIERHRRQALFACPDQPVRLRPVADDRDDVDRQPRLRNRLEIAAAPGQQHDDATGHR